ncbi:MAG: M48 family metallopeptidase [Gallionella sp.]
MAFYENPDYENPTIPEGINVTPEHPLKEFSILLGASVGIIFVAVLVLTSLAGYLVKYVPFAQEKALLSGLNASWIQPELSEAAQQKQQYLQALADQLSGNMSLPKDMTITVHYSEDKTVNAMATLGGNVVIFQGLIDILPNENALAMVMAHEIAHIQHRHPIVALGRGFAVMLALTSMAGVGDGMMQEWVGNMSMLTLLSFSRKQEAEADADALQGLLRQYGHVDDASAFFEYAAEKPKMEISALLSTHPGIEERISRIHQFENDHIAATKRELQPIPTFLKTGESQVK